MSPLDFPYVDATELSLQQRLTHCRHRFAFSDYQLALTIDKPSDDLDLALSAQWQGLPLRLLCQGTLLAHWLKPHLQEADFNSLPTALQLALLEREAQSIQGLTCSSLLSHRTSRASASLAIILTRGDDSLNLWLESDPTPLLTQLPKRPLAEMLPVPLRLSLQQGPVPICPAELRTLATGDLLLLPNSQGTDPLLRGVVEGRAWALFHQYDTQLELITMHNDNLEHADDILHNLDQLPIQVSFEVGRQSLDLHTYATLQSGSLIDLTTPLTGEVRILANQRCIGIGELINIQERLGVRVLRLMLDTPS